MKNVFVEMGKNIKIVVGKRCNLKIGHLLLKDKNHQVVKNIIIYHPTIKNVHKEIEKIKKHFNMENFYIDDSDFHLLYEQDKHHGSKQ